VSPSFFFLARWNTPLHLVYTSFFPFPIMLTPLSSDFQSGNTVQHIPSAHFFFEVFFSFFVLPTPPLPLALSNVTPPLNSKVSLYLFPPHLRFFRPRALVCPPPFFFSKDTPVSNTFSFSCISPPSYPFLLSYPSHLFDPRHPCITVQASYRFSQYVKSKLLDR